MPIRFGWVLIGILMAIVVHEAGHLICAMVVASPVRKVAVGAGPVLLRRRFGELWFELRLLPTLGFVSLYPAPVIRHRARSAIVLLGGVLANAAVIALVAIVTHRLALTASADEAIGAIIFTQAWLIFVNLLPFTVKVEGRQVGSDGRQLLALLQVKPGQSTEIGKAYTQMIAAYAQGGAPPPFTSTS